MIKRLLACAVLALVPVPMATAAHAAAAAAEAPASPEEIAKARAYADQLIAQAGAQDLFENITTDAVPKIRHKASGLTCGFDPGPEVRIFVGSNLPRGDDVGCESMMVDFKVSIYATRAPDPLTLDQATALYVDLIRRAHPEAKPFTGQSAEISVQSGPPVRTVRFVIKGPDGKPQFTRMAVAIVGPWKIDQRVTGPLENAMSGDLFGGIEMTMVLQDMAKSPGKP
jgi:hypothetical protein